MFFLPFSFLPYYHLNFKLDANHVLQRDWLFLAFSFILQWAYFLMGNLFYLEGCFVSVFGLFVVFKTLVFIHAIVWRPLGSVNIKAWKCNCENVASPRPAEPRTLFRQGMKEQLIERRKRHRPKPVIMIPFWYFQVLFKWEIHRKYGRNNIIARVRLVAKAATVAC